MWDSTEVLNMVGSIGILVTALGAVIVNIIVAVRTGKKVDESISKSNVISHQVAEVHTLTNSNLSGVKAELNKAVMQIEEMKMFIRDLKSERDKLALTTAINTEIAHPDRTNVLASIDENTRNIDTNTKKVIKEIEEK